MKNFSSSRLLTVRQKFPTTNILRHFRRMSSARRQRLALTSFGKPAIIYKHEGGVDGIATDIRKALDESLKLRLNPGLL